MPKDWEEILSHEYGLEAERVDEEQRGLYAVEAAAVGEDYLLPDGMATVRLGGAEYNLFVANVHRPDLPLLAQGEWTPEETQRLSRLIAHLRTRRVVIKTENNIVEREAAARAAFLEALKKRETAIAALLRQRLQEGGVEEYL